MLLRVRTPSSAVYAHPNNIYIYIALAAVSCLRSLAGFGFPLFAPAMFAKLGYGKGDTILACLAIALGCPAYVLESFIHENKIIIFFLNSHTHFRPLLLWKYGRRIRMSSKNAHKPQNRQLQS